MGKIKKQSSTSRNEKLGIRNNGVRTRNSNRLVLNFQETKKLIKEELIEGKVFDNGKRRSASRKVSNNSSGSTKMYEKFDCKSSSINEPGANCNESNVSEMNGNYCRNLTFQLKAMETGHRYHNLQIWKGAFINYFSSLNVFDIMNPFIRRVTAISWNHKYPNFAAVGSKGGELTLINTNSLKGTETYIEGVGPGGSINSIKFDNDNPVIVYTACLTGEVLCQDFERKQNAALLTTHETYDNWFCSLDILRDKMILAAGDCKGRIYFASTKGDKISNPIKIHTGKVCHIEICPKNANLMVTTSLDHTAKIWDIRQFHTSKAVRPLAVLTHNFPVNSAYFSEANSYSLLTTDQQKEIRVYCSHTWDLKTTIYQPHRQFQHLTPIKASWYPLEDIVVVGRFPDDKFLTSDYRSIDFYDANTGETLYRLSSPAVKGISVLNYFNSTGDILISGNGRGILFWRK